MGFISELFGRSNKISSPIIPMDLGEHTITRSDPETDGVDMNSWFLEKIKMFSGAGNAYRAANAENAWQIPTVFAIISIIAEDIASLGHDLYVKTPDGNSVLDLNNAKARLLGRPNDIMTAFTFKESMLSQMLSLGNAYAKIHYSKRGVASELQYFTANEVNVDYDYYKTKKKLFYHVNGERLPLFPYEMLHYKGISTDGIRGLSPLSLLNSTVHESLRSQDVALEFYDNGARVRSVLSTPGTLSDKQYNNLKNSFNTNHMGPEADPTLILEEGLTFAPISISPQDAANLLSRKHNIAELCRPFRMPLHMIQEMEGATFSNIEHQTLGYSKFCLRPYVKRLESEENFKLLNSRDFGKRYHKYNLDSLLRADVKTRAEHLKVMYQNGFMTQNEVRKILNLPAMEGGDVLMTPVNMRDKLTEPLGGKIKTEPSSEEK